MIPEWPCGVNQYSEGWRHGRRVLSQIFKIILPIVEKINGSSARIPQTGLNPPPGKAQGSRLTTVAAVHKSGIDTAGRTQVQYELMLCNCSGATLFRPFSEEESPDEELLKV
jgi:hypothetical protein